MRISQDIRDQHKSAMAGMRDKSREFIELGASVYVDAAQ